MGQIFDKKDFSKLFVQPNTATTPCEKNEDRAANKRKGVHSAVVSPLTRDLPTRVQILMAASGLPPFE
jgi:hypothetical protein